MWVTFNVYSTESKKMTASPSVVQNSEDVTIIKDNQTEQPLRTNRWWNSESEDRLTDQCETVIGSHQLLDAVLLQHHHPGQHRALGASAVLTVHHVALLTAVLAGHEQQVEHLHLHGQSHASATGWRQNAHAQLRVTHVAFVAVVGRLILHAALIADFFPYSHQLLSHDLDVFDGLHQAVSKRQKKKTGIQLRTAFVWSKSPFHNFHA